MTDEFIAESPEYQAKILAFMLHDNEFRMIAAAHLDKELFSNRALQWFFSTIGQSDVALSPTTLGEEVLQAVRAGIIPRDEGQKYSEVFTLLKSLPLPQEREYIRGHITSFMRKQALKLAIPKAKELSDEDDWAGVLELMTEAINKGVDLDDIGVDYFADAENRIQNRVAKERDQKIFTQIQDLDLITNGGIKVGQTGLIVGGTGRGKSIFLAWLGKAAVAQGKTVVYITCELSTDVLADRYDSMLGKTPISQLTDYQDALLADLKSMSQIYSSKLWLKHYPADTATVHTIKAYIRQLSYAGVVPDMVIIDYLDLLKPHRTYNSPHLEIDAIMKAVVGFAAEFGVVVYTATQMNRSGMTQDTPDEASMAGYIGKQYHADLILWMAQTAEEKEDEVMRLWVSKNRNGAAGKTITLDTDYACMTFYRDNSRIEAGLASTESVVVPPTSPAVQDLADQLKKQLDHQESDG